VLDRTLIDYDASDVGEHRPEHTRSRPSDSLE
jgi:hypothetical protein